MAAGETLAPARRFEEAEVLTGGAWRRLAELELRAPYRHDPVGADGSDDLSEYVIPVRWLHAVELEDAYWEGGMFANQHSACRLAHGFTRDRLVTHMGLSGGEGL